MEFFAFLPSILLYLLIACGAIAIGYAIIRWLWINKNTVAACFVVVAVVLAAIVFIPKLGGLL